MTEQITIVSGLPRSGTSMMMKMLAAGGIPVLTDNIRSADDDNPGGYYEFERVKQIKTDNAWLADAGGKAVKMISRLLNHLPENYRYRVVFMRRNMDEILASQQKMLQRRGITGQSDDREMAGLFNDHLESIQRWLAGQNNFSVLYLWYHEVLNAPAENIEKLSAFFDHQLDTAAIAAVIDQSLYRNRK